MLNCRNAAKMMFLALCCSITGSIATEDADDKKIPDAPSREVYPYIVSVRVSTMHVCSGTIIQADWILTSARHIGRLSASSLTVMASELKLYDNLTASMDVVKVVIHPNFSHMGNQAHDLALLKLKDHFIFSELVSPVVFPESMDSLKGAQGLLVGWVVGQGTEVLVTMQQILVEVMGHGECMMMYGHLIHEDGVCAGTRSYEESCKGDFTGGPLLIDFVQIGVVGWSPSPCDLLTSPAIITSIYPSLTWIKEETYKSDVHFPKLSRTSSLSVTHSLAISVLIITMLVKVV